MAANRLVCISVIIAVIIKNGIAKSNIELESGFKPFFPKIMTSSTAPTMALNSIANNNNISELLHNDTLDFTASKLVNEETELQSSASTVDQKHVSKRFGLLGFLPSFNFWRPPFLINPFAPRPLFPTGPLNPPPPFLRTFNGNHPHLVMPPVPNIKPNSSYPDGPIPNISSQGPYGTVSEQPPPGPSSAQKRPINMYVPRPVPVNHAIPILEKPNDNRRFPVYPTTFSPARPGPQNELQEPRYGAPTQLKPSVANIPLHQGIDPRTPAMRQHIPQNSSQPNTYRESKHVPQHIETPAQQPKYGPRQNASYGTSNSPSHFQVAQQLLSISLQQPSYKATVAPYKPSAQHSSSPSKQNAEMPKSVSGYKNSPPSKAAKSYKLQSANYTDKPKETKTYLPHGTPQNVYLTIIYANSNSTYNASGTSYVRQPSNHNVPMKDLLNYIPLRSYAPVFRYDSKHPSSSTSPKTNPSQSLKGYAPAPNYASYKSHDTVPVLPASQKVPSMGPVYPPSYSAQAPPNYNLPPTSVLPQLPANYFPTALRPPRYMPQQPSYSSYPSRASRQYSPPQKYSYTAPGLNSYLPQMRHYMPQQYAHLTASNLEAQNRENYFANAPETDPEVSAKLLWGAHTFNHALQKLKSPSIHPFGRHLPGADSNNEQFSDCGHTWLSYMEAPAEMAGSRSKVSTNKSNRVRDISDSVVENNDAATSISATETVSKDTVDKHLPGTSVVGSTFRSSHLPQPYAERPHYNPYLPVHGPVPYYVAPYIVTNIRVQSPENSGPLNPQLPPIYTPIFTPIKHGGKLEEMEKANSETGEPEISNHPVIPTFRAVMTKRLNATNVDSMSMTQSLETSTVASSQSSTSKTPIGLKPDVPTTLSPPSTASKMPSGHSKSTSSIKELTPLRLQGDSTHSKRPVATSTVASTAKSQSELSEELFFAQHVPSAIVGNASKASKS